MIKLRWSPMRQLAVFAGMVLVLEAVTVFLRLPRDLTPFVLVVIPAAAALGVTFAAGGRVGMKQLLARTGRWRVGGRWYVAAIGIPVAEKLVVDVVGAFSGVTSLSRLLAALTASALVVPLVVLVPALLEELGWRGFGVQAAVDGGHSPAWAAVVVGVLFILMHVPLYLPGAALRRLAVLAAADHPSYLLDVVDVDLPANPKCAPGGADARLLQRHHAFDLRSGSDVGLAGASYRLDHHYRIGGLADGHPVVAIVARCCPASPRSRAAQACLR
jgi:hypothetical protein